MTDSPTLTEDQARAEAALFDEAERTATQVRQTTSVHPDMTLDDAYRVQAAWLDLRLARGERREGVHRNDLETVTRSMV